MLETSNPEVLLLYSYFAPHVRRLVWAFLPYKPDKHSEGFDNTKLHAGSESISSTPASRDSTVSKPFLGRNQIPLTAIALGKQKPDILKKGRKPQGPKTAVDESLQSGRRRRVNLLIVATGEATNLLIQEIC